MWNKITRLYWSRIFFIASLSISLICLIISSANIFWANFLNFYFPLKIVTTICVIFFTLTIIIFIKQNRSLKIKLISYISWSFLIILFLITISFLKYDFINKIYFLNNIILFLNYYSFYLVIIGFSFGFLNIYISQGEAGNQSKNKNKKLLDIKKQNIILYQKKFQIISKIPIINNVLKWLYIQKCFFSITFILITTLFIFIKIWLPIIYSGSYIDETIHLLSGFEFFKTGHFSQLYYGQFYNRGAYVSFIVGLFFKLFGQSIYVAKLVPAIVGVINYFLSIFIAQRFIKKKFYILLFALIYTLNPWTIFNQFYIRIYVFYELFLLLTICLFLNLLKNIKIKKFNYILINIFSIIFLNAINILFSSDSGLYLILLANLCFSVYVYFLYIDKIIQKLKLTKFNLVKYFLPILIILVFFFLLNIPSKISGLFNSNLMFSTPENFKYSYYFFNRYILFSIFFLLSLNFLSIYNLTDSVIIIIGVLLFIAHLVSSKDLQVM